MEIKKLSLGNIQLRPKTEFEYLNKGRPTFHDSKGKFSKEREGVSHRRS